MLKYISYPVLHIMYTLYIVLSEYDLICHLSFDDILQDNYVVLINKILEFQSYSYSLSQLYHHLSLLYFKSVSAPCSYSLMSHLSLTSSSPLLSLSLHQRLSPSSLPLPLCLSSSSLAGGFRHLLLSTVAESSQC